MKIVIDTNVFISALIGKESSYSRKIIELIFNEKLTPLMDEALFNEYLDVIGRDKTINLCPLSKQEMNEFLAAFMNCCQWQKIYFNWRPNLKDEADNHVIELAVASGAKYIITSNIKDLASGELLFKDIKIVTPNDFIKEQLWEQLH